MRNMSLLIPVNNTNSTCPFSLSWSQSVLDGQRPILYVSIVAAIIHSFFWLQFIFYPSVRQKTMQWLYAYMITDILLLVRFFTLYVIHTTSNQCVTNRSWFLFVCYMEACIENYLNILEVYILLSLNVCRYVQIAYNRNLYVTHVRLLVVAHVCVYLIPFIRFIIEILVGWASVEVFVGNTCAFVYTNVYAQIVGFVIDYILPISLNILVIYISLRKVHLTSHLRRGKHHVSAREKYHRSLVIQFLVFYTVWILLWSPYMIIYQFISGSRKTIVIGDLLSFIETALDPIIIAGLDVRFQHVWRQIWRSLKQKVFVKATGEQKQMELQTITRIFQRRCDVQETHL